MNVSFRRQRNADNSWVSLRPSFPFLHVLGICVDGSNGGRDQVATFAFNHCLRSYHVENTGSRPITEVKQRRARTVLEWVTA